MAVGLKVATPVTLFSIRASIVWSNLLNLSKTGKSIPALNVIGLVMEITKNILKGLGILVVACFGLVIWIMFGFLFGTLNGKR